MKTVNFFASPKKSKRLALLLLPAMVLIYVFATSIAAQAATYNKSPGDYPDPNTWSAVKNVGVEIGEKLCADDKPKKDSSKLGGSACAEAYVYEYLYLAFVKCDGEDGEAKQTSCYKKFRTENDAMGKARKDAGFDPGKKVTAESTGSDDLGGNPNANIFQTGSTKGQCGNTPDAVKTKFDIGCIGSKPNAPNDLSPINDMMYAFIRFLSIGVGIVIVLSIIAAGIQYSSSEGNAEATQAAKDRIRNAIIGLVIYLFTFSFVQYLVPGGVFASSMLVSAQSYLESIMRFI